MSEQDSTLLTNFEHESADLANQNVDSPEEEFTDPGALDVEPEESTEPEAQVSEEPKEEEFEIPPKFRGKDVKDIVQAYMELEKELGRKGNEIGELRKLTDQLLKLEMEKVKSQQPGVTDGDSEEDDEITIDDLLEHPEKVVERSPLKKEVDELKSKLLEREIKERQSQFEAKHPDWRDIAVTPEFQEWVTQSRYRAQLFQAADKFDFEAADELFSLWKDLRGTAQRTESEDKATTTSESVKNARAKATLERSGRQTGAKKVYRRADIIRLKLNDPERYAEMADEILQAYAEGRVR